jgi:hypothetical protein
MQRDPIVVPRKAGIYALANKKRRYAYIAYSRNLQKRSHGLAHMLTHPEAWSIANLPRHPAEEWTFMTLRQDITPEQSGRMIANIRRQFEEKNYTVIDGSRSPLPTIELDGEKMTLVDAIAKAGCKDQYITVWRRLKRGWSVRQAIGMDPAPVRWDPEQVEARRARAQAS